MWFQLILSEPYCGTTDACIVRFCKKAAELEKLSLMEGENSLDFSISDGSI